MINDKKRFIVFFIIFLFLFSQTNQIYSSKCNAKGAEVVEEPDDSSEPKLGPIKFLIKKFGSFATFLSPIFRLSVVAIRSEPSVIEIGFNETVNVDIGLWDLEKNKFEYFTQENTVFTSRYVNFEVIEYPGGNENGEWSVNFFPYTLEVKKGETLKTNMTVSLVAPITFDNPIQSGVLKIKVKDEWNFGNIWFPPKGSPSDTFTGRLFWFMSAAFIMRFGKYTGTTDVLEKNYSILVKVKPYHALKFDSQPKLTVQPDKLVSLPVTVKNLGNYNDTYSFRLNNSDSTIKLSSPYSITLAPGETKQVYLGISAPLSAFDYGTINNVVIEAYSIDDPDVTVAKRDIIIETKGVYVSEASIAGLLSLTTFICVLILLYVFWRRKKDDGHVIKPKKPWAIPKEKEKLEKLRKKDEKEYQKKLKKMKENYKSEMKLYQELKKKTPKKTTAKKGSSTGFSKLFSGFLKPEDTKITKNKPEVESKKLDKTPKTDDIKPPVKEEKIQIQGEQTIPKPSTVEQNGKVNVIKSEQNLQKQRAILRVKKQQEKQIRKFQRYKS